MYYLCPKEINKNKMEISGKIIAVLEKQSGISKSGNNWASQEYVLETSEQYPKKICFRVFGEDKINQFAVKEGASDSSSLFVGRELKPRFKINTAMIPTPASM